MGLEDALTEYQRCHEEYLHAQEEARRITGKYFVTSTGTPIQFGEVITSAADSEMQDADAVLDRAYKAYTEAKRRLVESHKKEGS